MTKHSRHERQRRIEESERVKQVEAAWVARVPPAVAKAFAIGVETARTRGPEARRPDMAPGTLPRPPRPGREPKVEVREPSRNRRDN
jgi:hypothetical protein